MRYVLRDGLGEKFWEIERIGAEIVIRHGKVGREGQERRKVHASVAIAKGEHDKLVLARLRIGYLPDMPPVDPGPPGLDPASAEDVLVYADWLLQRGDPVGEYLVAAQQEPGHAEELLARRFEDWAGPRSEDVRYRWRHGLVRSIDVTLRSQPIGPLLAALIRAPLARFLDTLEVSDVFAWRDAGRGAVAAVVSSAPRPWTVRELALPADPDADARPLWAVAPRLRRLALPGLVTLGTVDLPELEDATLGVGPKNATNLGQLRLPTVERLELRGTVGAPELAPLLAGRGTPRLRSLVLRGEGADDAIGRLLDGDLPERLAGLELDRCGATNEAVWRLVAARGRFAGLETLVVRGNRNDPASLAALRDAFPFATGDAHVVDEDELRREHDEDDEDDEDDRYDDVGE